MLVLFKQLKDNITVLKWCASISFLQILTKNIHYHLSLHFIKAVESDSCLELQRCLKFLFQTLLYLERLWKKIPDLKCEL